VPKNSALPLVAAVGICNFYTPDKLAEFLSCQLWQVLLLGSLFFGCSWTVNKSRFNLYVSLSGTGCLLGLFSL